MTAKPATSDYLDGMMNVLDGFGKTYTYSIKTRLGEIKAAFEANNYYLAEGTAGLDTYYTAVYDIQTLEQSLTSTERSQIESWANAHEVKW